MNQAAEFRSGHRGLRVVGEVVTDLLASCHRHDRDSTSVSRIDIVVDLLCRNSSIRFVTVGGWERRTKYVLERDPVCVRKA